MEKLIYHTLKGVRGWSDLTFSKIDVFKVKNLHYDERLFCIFNRKYPYKLTIYYGTRQTYIITKRYKTETEVQNEINEIQLKQKKIESLKNKFMNENRDEIDKFNV